MKLRKIHFFVITVFALIIAYFGTLYCIQDRLIFKPHTQYISPQKANIPMFNEQILTMSDGTDIMTWYTDGDKNKPAVLFFHGNSTQMANFTPHLLPIVENKNAVFSVEYRGFGNSEGKISQEKMFSDGAEVFDFIKKKGYKRIILIGYSFGTAASLGVSTLRPANGVVLIAPFASLTRLVGEKVPLSNLVLKDDYPSEDYIKDLTVPLLILHGNQDPLIPYQHAETLYQNAGSPDKTFILSEGFNHKQMFFDEKTPHIIVDWINKRW